MQRQRRNYVAFQQPNAIASQTPFAHCSQPRSLAHSFAWNIHDDVCRMLQSQQTEYVIRFCDKNDSPFVSSFFVSFSLVWIIFFSFSICISVRISHLFVNILQSQFKPSTLSHFQRISLGRPTLVCAHKKTTVSPYGIRKVWVCSTNFHFRCKCSNLIAVYKIHLVDAR